MPLKGPGVVPEELIELADWPGLFASTLTTSCGYVIRLRKSRSWGSPNLLL